MKYKTFFEDDWLANNEFNVEFTQKLYQFLVKV